MFKCHFLLCLTHLQFLGTRQDFTRVLDVMTEIRLEGNSRKSTKKI